jgi:hypothetical protein
MMMRDERAVGEEFGPWERSAGAARGYACPGRDQLFLLAVFDTVPLDLVVKAGEAVTDCRWCCRV